MPILNWLGPAGVLLLFDWILVEAALSFFGLVKEQSNLKLRLRNSFCFWNTIFDLAAAISWFVMEAKPWDIALGNSDFTYILLQKLIAQPGLNSEWHNLLQIFGSL